MNFVLHQDMKNTRTLIFNHLRKFFTVESRGEGGRFLLLNNSG